jgi:hypothetical protein
MAVDWSDEELSLCVSAYLRMCRMTALSEPFVKYAIYKDLSAETGRTPSSIELRMQNISAVVMNLNKNWLPGLLPAVNVGANVSQKLSKLILDSKDFIYLQPLEKISYQFKLPAMREWLIRVAQEQRTVIYGELMQAFDVDRFSLRHAMDQLGRESVKKGEPIITALIVSKATGRCSVGLNSAFGISDDVQHRKDLYACWSEKSASKAVEPLSVLSSVKERAARYASIEVRSDQAAFRRRVYERYEGVCAISGCKVDRALDAAHKNGRSWRQHNAASDGSLLRKDLHALYDSGLLAISDDGVVSVSPDAAPDYSAFDQMTIAPW